MKILISNVVLLSSMVFLIGCTSQDNYIHSKTKNYPPLKCPPGFSHLQKDDYLKIPEISENKPLTKSIRKIEADATLLYPPDSI